MSQDDELREAADDLTEDLVEWRRDLHRNPELAFQERRTSGFVAGKLGELGIEVRTGIADTGVVGVLRAKASASPGVLLRADMDALPIQEVAGRDYGSSVDGRMHACGHDGHTSMLLGAATLLAARRESLSRDVVFCFQPAEESEGGARRMIAEGVLDLVPTGSVYALHVWSQYPVGTACLRPGPAMAAQDEFRASIVGVGGHGASPHEARDPIVAAAQAVTALQSVVARSVDPIESAVVTVGKLHAGTAPNIIPEQAYLEGTLRSFTDPVRRLLQRRTREVLESTASAAGCRLEFELDEGYPAVINDAQSVAAATTIAGRVFGGGNVTQAPPIMGAEDFAYFLEERPGAFIFVGAGNEERGITAPHHSPMFDIDEAVLPRGAELLARIALDQGTGC